MASQHFVGYWLGYQQGGPPPERTPPSVSVVSLAFAVTGPGPHGDTITLDFLTSQHPESEIRAGAKALQARGVKVLMSINGAPDWPGHPGGWTNLDAQTFAANVAKIVVGDWGLDGVDLDNEAAETPGQNFVDVVKALRAQLGPSALITLPVYEGTWRDGYLAQVKDEISFVCTMAYWYTLQGQKDLFDTYAALVGPEKVAIGVANAANPGQDTPKSEVPALAAWNPPNAAKAGMMLWNLNAPSEKETLDWCEMISENLP